MQVCVAHAKAPALAKQKRTATFEALPKDGAILIPVSKGIEIQIRQIKLK